MTNKTRIKKLEKDLDLTKTSSYQFIRFSGFKFNDDEWQGKCYKKEDFKGPVIIWKLLAGQSARTIDPSSEEYEEILKEHGYQQINADV